MMNVDHMPPPPVPPTTLEVISRFLDLVGASGGTAEGVKAAALEIERHNENVSRHELARVQFAEQMQTERDKLAGERLAFENVMAEREAALKAEADKIEAKWRQLREIRRELQRCYDGTVAEMKAAA